ncbi:flagellar type III secretion system pore protein FliP [Spartinivicinus ruber]|uniref:flagellar type III secretion system pore protein FliP n=1 Tax=Spartinivicinus ruber TaxID=2683272 RepID=UPI001E40A1F4|nr:flagellar type III secretion system pore protein FliP [Spartinivicinus ruber]
MVKFIHYPVILCLLNLILSYFNIALADDISVAGISVSFNDDTENTELATPIQFIILVTIISLAPAFLMMLTSFTRIVIVLSMLRQALGMPQTPPNSVLISLALFLTIFSMLPLIEKINEQAYQPYINHEILAKAAFERIEAPVKQFLISHTREKDLSMVVEMSGKSMPTDLLSVSMTTLVPAFMLSELQVAFQIGFIIFLPFLLIDLLVSCTLMSVGMIMLPPMTISLPLKILVFVLVDGWSLIAQSLVGSFLG